MVFPLPSSGVMVCCQRPLVIPGRRYCQRGSGVLGYIIIASAVFCTQTAGLDITINDETATAVYLVFVIDPRWYAILVLFPRVFAFLMCVS